MEAVDNKGQEATIANPNLKVEPNTSPKSKADVPEKIVVKNGSADGEDKKPELEKGTSPKAKEEINNKSTTAPSKQAESASNKQSNTKPVKSSREEKYSRRKDERGVDQLMRSLNSLETPQDKLDALVKKYSEVADENRKLQTQTKNMERRLIQVEREKDSAQSEYSKAVLTRSRLEGLCRELQRQNRAIKEESVLKIREEEEKRKEVSNKFQSTLAEITSLMQQNNEKNSKLRDDNIEMTTKFKSVCEQYELRVQQVEKISKQMQLEAQLADAKLAKAQLESKAEKEVLIREKHELLMELAHYQARAKEHEQTELKLREQVELYTNKYDEFQTALSRSNEVFGGFKEEMDKMSKKIVKLEKETSTWKLRWEKSHQALLEMATDKQQRDAELSLANRQLTQLHKLCRTLTEERAKLMAQINAVGKEPDAAKEEKLAADIAEDGKKLNDTLDSLQSVILERELLHKQQQLEKQQQQLQIELQKHIAASVANAEPTPKACDTKTTEKTAEAKTNSTKPVENKAPSGKNSEANKKKGKKQKPGRQNSSEKVFASGESKVETAESVKSEEGITADNSSSAPVKEAPQTLSAQTESSSSSKSDPPATTSVAEKKVEPVKQEIVSPVTPTKTDTQESQVSSVIDPPTESTSAPQTVPDSTSVPPAFSYAAAVGSKPAEHPVAEKPQSEKSVEKPATPEKKCSTPAAESKTTPAAPAKKTASAASEKNPLPAALENNTVTAASENTTVPAAPEKASVPVAPENKTVPAAPENKTVPTVSEDKTVPAAHEEKIVPENESLKPIDVNVTPNGTGTVNGSTKPLSVENPILIHTDGNPPTSPSPAPSSKKSKVI
ncbi:hypothetical protein ONE63_000570 [Megalurothrips usitatus]|uniref:Beta-taxilin n=1 Tax=Megalurothrips usitatus TaxID=439358 RepID=A0AAV7XYV7_9NEOP|nr:hypothetical protein ONE63_000570 [Megalurothrips usitatus]